MLRTKELQILNGAIGTKFNLMKFRNMYPEMNATLIEVGYSISTVRDENTGDERMIYSPHVLHAI